MTEPSAPMTNDLTEIMARGIVRRNWPSLNSADVEEMAEGYSGDALAAIEALTSAGYAIVHVPKGKAIMICDNPSIAGSGSIQAATKE